MPACYRLHMLESVSQALMYVRYGLHIVGSLKIVTVSKALSNVRHGEHRDKEELVRKKKLIKEYMEEHGHLPWYKRPQPNWQKCPAYRYRKSRNPPMGIPIPLCEAKCRDGHSCKAKAACDKFRGEPLNGRCRMHGGLSTGAKSKEGRVRCSEAASRGMKAYWERRRQAVNLKHLT